MPADGEFGPERFAELSGVSRETLAHLKTYAGMLEDWSALHNLVSRASLDRVWQRHIWDSAQLAAHIPDDARSLVDLGAGAGFPGLVLAELMRERPGFRTVLYESTGKKCRFLQAVVDRLKLCVEIRNERIEEAAPEKFDVVTARALAPLDRLLPYAHRFWAAKTVGLFLKGQNVGVELTEVRKSWRMRLEQRLSQSDPSGVVLVIRELHRADRSPTASPA